MLGKLIDLIDRLNAVDASDRLNPPVIYAEGGPAARPSARAAISPEDEGASLLCPLDPSLSYVLEVKTARETIRGWSAWRGGRTPSSSDRFAAVVHYARNDSFLPPHEGRT